MTQIRIKRVYEEPNATDGYRVLVDRLWPRGIKKEHLKYDVWEKDITPSPELRKWFHEDQAEHWEGFAAMYRKELENSEAALRFIDTIKHHHTITLLYASKAPIYNHARILQRFLQEHLDSLLTIFTVKAKMNCNSGKAVQRIGATRTQTSFSSRPLPFP